MLEVDQIEVFYGNLRIIKKISFNVESKKITTIVGSNGAGKSTILKAIAGFVPVRSGKINFAGTDVQNQPPYKIVHLGLSFVDESVKIFPYMTVKENLLLGAYRPKAWKERNDTVKSIFELFPRLAERTGQLAVTLSGGERRMLGIGRGLMSQPNLLMLDEPSSGLAPIMVSAMFEAIKNINHAGTSILIVEQNVWETLNLAHVGYVIENGKIVLEGKGDELLGNSSVKAAYLRV